MSEQKEYIVVTARLPKDIYELLSDKALEENRSLSKEISFALEKYLIKE